MKYSERIYNRLARSTNLSTRADCADIAAEADAEIERLRAATADLLTGWRYIRASHGDLYGAGWDRAQAKAEAALGLGAEAPIPTEFFGA